MHTQKLQKSRRITNELIDEVCRYIRVGTPILISGKAAGISSGDFHLWMKEGSSDFHSMECINCDYALFYEVITKEEARMQAFFFASIYEAALKGDWRASAWWLEYNNVFDSDSDTPQKLKSTQKIQPATPISKETMQELSDLIDEVIAKRPNKVAQPTS
jgi:hypothetical protein